MSNRSSLPTDGEMNVRRAHRLKAVLMAECPKDSFEVWAIGQGLAYIKVTRPYGQHVVELVLHNEAEVSQFIDRAQLLRNREAELFAADKARNGDDSWRIE